MKKLLILLLTACSLFGQFKFQRSLPDRYTVLHVRGNGQNGSTIIPDVSQYGNTVTAYNGAVISATQNKFYNSSIYFDGSNDYLGISTNSLFVLGTGNFTIDFWFYALVNSSDDGLFQFDPNFVTNKIGASVYATKMWYVLSTQAAGSTTITTNTWHHCAIVRNGTLITCYIDGLLDYSVTDATTYSDNGRGVYIGRYATGNYYFPGYIQNFRVTIIPLWTSNFIPPNRY